jgi:eukaryotic-like serine/threonine-protein kinase
VVDVPGGERQERGEPAAGQAFGRYAILERLGSGGMGVVFAAHDPQLDRRVALKVLRLDSIGEGSKAGEYTERLDGAGNTRDLVRERILTEARALARLSHPNLVTVFEVGAVGEQLYLAMEHIAGANLNQWLRADPERSWRDVLGAFVQAGQGLAAAHAAGLVHGDFKPDNVVVEEATGRVCVVDFGVARAAGSRARTGPAGTPLYMAPEQLAGRPVDARADQFAFSIALYQALYGEWPFPLAVTGHARVTAQGGAAPTAPARRRGPRRVLRALLRGLSVDPDARFPSMVELLSALGRSSTALRVAQAAAAVALVGFLGFTVATTGDDDAEQCTGGPARLAVAWSPQRRALMERGFAATGRPHAAASAAHAGQELDRYGRSWLAAYRGACLDSARGEQSPDLLDRRVACLDLRLDEMRARAALLSDRPDGEVVDRTLDVVDDLEPLGSCADTAALLGASPPPSDPQRRADAAAVEQAIDRASLERLAGRVGAAVKTSAEAVARARALDHPPVRAHAALEHGRALLDSGRAGEAEEALHEALAAAERAGDDALAAEIQIRLVFVVGNRLSRVAEGRTLARLAEAAIGRAGDRADPDLKAELYVSMGSVALEAGDPREAESLYRQALAIRRELLGPDDRRVASTENHLGGALVRQNRNQEARAHYGEALAIRRRTLGDDHIRVSDLHANIGISYHVDGRYKEAREHYLRATAIRSRVPEYTNANVLDNLGTLEEVDGNHAAAIRYQQAALAERRDRFGKDSPTTATSLNNLGSTYVAAGELRRGLELVREAMAIRRRTLGEDHPEYGKSHLAVGETLRRLGRPREAIEHLDQAAAILSKRSGAEHPDTLAARGFRAIAHIDLGRPGNARAELERFVKLLPEADPDHALFRFGLARVLIVDRRQRRRAIELARGARTQLASARRTGELAQVDAWLRRHARRR